MAATNKKQAYRGEDRQSWPAWMWLGIGVLLGIVLSVVVLIKDWAPMLHRKNLPQPNPDATAPRESEQALADEANKKPAPAKKNYEFYTVLTETEVAIPDAELSAKAKAEQQRLQQQAAAAQSGVTSPNTTAPIATADAGSHYYLLAGSFSDPKAADEAKAKLALLGVIAKVQTITVNGKVYNRVRVGPYSTASDAESAKKTLADNNVNAVPLKEAGGQ
jgi:cell division protein FtsN